ncbi:PAS domain S-box protein [Parasediminibacterium paludis]|uniref:histidine kinase n=1 Tax=Parasediminibacterium paludis TaxID=908966 RepID=A0ABV8PXF1_9BACT
MPEILSFRKVLRFSPQPTILLQVSEQEAIVEVVNKAYLELLGTKEESIIHKALFNTPNFGLSDINAHTVTKLKQLIDECLFTKTSVNLVEQCFSVLNIFQNSLSQHIFSFTITPIIGSVGSQSNLVLISLTDETEKIALKDNYRQLQEELTALEDDVQEIEQKLKIGRWEIDVASGKIWWSDEVYIICGYEPQSFDPGKRDQFSITHPDDIEIAKKALQETIEFGVPFSIERRLFKANGDILYALSKGKAVKNDAGEIVKVKGFFQDITQRVLQNEAINAIKTNQEALINGTNDLVWLMNTKMQVLVANEAYYDKMKQLAEGYQSDNEAVLEARNERLARWTGLIPEVLKGNSLSFKEKILNPFNNTYEYALVSINPIKNDKGEIENIACFAKDITLETNNLHTLESTKTRLENILAASPDIICSLDGNAVFIDVNAASEKILGYKPEEMIGKSIAVFLPPEELAKTVAEAPKVRETGKLIHFENKYIKKDSSLINISWTGSYQAEKDILYCVGRDVTEKKKQEEALEASKKDYQNLFEANPSPMLIWDFETWKITDANIQSGKLFGYTHKELLELSILDLIPNEDITLAKSTFKIQDNKGYYIVQGVKHKKKNSEIILVDITAHNLNYKGKKSSLVLINDVTEKIKIQKAIAESEAKYRSLFENSVDGIFITKKTGGIIDVNPSGCKMLQMTKAEVCKAGRKGTVDISDTRLDIFLKEREKLGYAKSILTHIRKDGNKFEAEVSSSTFTDANGNDLNALIVRDITERIKNQEQLRESNERFNHVTKATSEAIWDWNLITGEIFWGDGFKTILGYDNKSIIPTYQLNMALVHPRDVDRVNKKVLDTISSEENFWEESYRFLKADKTYIQIINRAYIIRDKYGKATRMVGAKRDISQYQYYSELEKLERNILAINEAGDKSLEEVLSIYLLGIEVLHPGMTCSILQLRGNQLFNLSTPSLPEAYINAINGVTIGENTGSCGTAAFTKKNVIVSDIANDPRWINYKVLAEEHGLKACWSHPIFNQKEAVIATFAAYYQQVKTPSALEENTINRASNILKIILESYERTQALKESNERYNLATKATSDAIWDWDLATGYMIWGEGWQSIFGFDTKTIEKNIAFKLSNTHPDDLEKLRSSYYTIVKSDQTNWEEQYRLKKANGEYAYVVSKGFVIRNKAGRAIRMVGATRDITLRKQEELRLKLLESVITNTNDAVVVSETESLTSSDPRIVYVNDAFTKMTGYTASEMLGKNPRILQGPKSDRKELDKLKASLKKWEACEATLLNYRKDGTEFWVNINISPVADENGWHTHWVAIQRDVTEKILEEQNLTKAIIKAQENERYEIGGELHDNVCQILTSSQLSLKMLKKALGPKELVWYDNGVEAITLASREIRNLSHRLAPSFFNDTTLELAITTLVQTFNIEEKYQIHILFDDKFKAQPSKQEFQINLYRIVQEQLKNIFKYAEATVIEIVGTIKNEKLRMEIIDNGMGFNIHQSSTGIGMANMKRRTELFLGKFEVVSSMGKGCKVTVEIPLEEIN